MPTIPRPHPRTASARITHALTALAMALGLALVAPAGAGAVVARDAGAPAPGSGSGSGSAAPSGCGSGPAQARVMRGASEGADPNSVSAAEARSMDRALRQRIADLAAHGTHHGLHPARVTVPTYVHVITRADGTGGVRARQVRAQIRVLNASYAGATSPEAAATPFRFVLRGLDRTANDEWYDWDVPTATGPGTVESEAKPALHRGGWRALNLYVTSLPDDLLGYTYYPSTVPLALDGTVVRNESLPGGTAAPYNRGDTVVHEVGHWLGLLHTFENGCHAPGDYVGDTPYQADGQNIFYCNADDDTCPQFGTDPVHNFMSYGDDQCLDQFTHGQSRRMVRTWVAFRASR